MAAKRTSFGQVKKSLSVLSLDFLDSDNHGYSKNQVGGLWVECST